MVSATLLMIIYVSFISLGLPDSMLGSAWPVMSGDLNAPLWGAGFIQMTVSFFTIISSLNSARLIRRFGTGKLTAISVATTAVALLGFSFAHSYFFLVLLAIPLGLGAGAVDSGLNNYVAMHCQARHMSWLHCFWGVGAVIGPIILSRYLAAGNSWNSGYRMVGLMQAVLSVILFMTLSKWKQANTEEEDRSAKVLSVRQVLALPGAKAGMLCFFCYCAMESIFFLWSSTYMVTVRGVGEVQAASWGALYVLGMTVGRALSGFMTLKFKPRQMVRIGLSVQAIGCVLLFIPHPATMIAAFLICGLGSAPVYPNIMQDTPINYGAENSQAAVGVQMAFAYTGSTFMPTIIGAVADRLGYGIVPFVASALTLLMIVLFNEQARIVDSRHS